MAWGSHVGAKLDVNLACSRRPAALSCSQCVEGRDRPPMLLPPTFSCPANHLTLQTIDVPYPGRFLLYVASRHSASWVLLTCPSLTHAQPTWRLQTDAIKIDHTHSTMRPLPTSFAGPAYCSSLNPITQPLSVRLILYIFKIGSVTLFTTLHTSDKNSISRLNRARPRSLETSYLCRDLPMLLTSLTADCCHTAVLLHLCCLIDHCEGCWSDFATTPS